MEIDDVALAPQLTLTQAFDTLTKIKKTATGPDGIPFWVWKDFSAILSPVVMNIWNMSLLSHVSAQGASVLERSKCQPPS